MPAVSPDGKGASFLYRAIGAISRAACALPERPARAAIVGAAMVFSQVPTRERRRIAEAIDRTYHRCGRPLPRPVSDILARMYAHVALNVYELLRYPTVTSASLRERIRLEGWEHLNAALAEGRGVVLVLPHIGTWELFGAAIVDAGYKLHSFYMAQKENELGAAIDDLRRFSGIVLHDRDRGLVRALRALKQGEILGMLADQDGGNHGVYLDFLGHWISLPAGPANWSLKTGAAVIPIHCLRQGLSGRFVGRFLPPFPAAPGATHTERVLTRTQALARWMEDLILRHPEQYPWFYDRFKARPHGYLAGVKADDSLQDDGAPLYRPEG